MYIIFPLLILNWLLDKIDSFTGFNSMDISSHESKSTICSDGDVFSRSKINKKRLNVESDSVGLLNLKSQTKLNDDENVREISKVLFSPSTKPNYHSDNDGINKPVKGHTYEKWQELGYQVRKGEKARYCYYGKHVFSRDQVVRKR
jgi:hypothetical protein